jgi:2-hydroxy-3-oxopropionate reductase
MANIGFIGLGIMGKPMAQNLIKGGHSLFLHSRSGVPGDLIEQGGKASSSARQVAQNSDIIITMLPDTPDVEKVLFGENGVVQGLNQCKTVVDMSSISPIETKKFSARINHLGCFYVDAPVSGGDMGAKNGTLTIMVGAQEQVFEKVKPILELMGNKITLVGDNGAGQICKIANQIIVALTIEAVGEALLFASKAGANPNKIRQALMGGFASSRVLEIHGERMIMRAFNPGFRVELHRKDLNIALTNAHALGINLPNTAATQELFNACIAQGNAKLDSSVMIRALEKLANH